MVTASSSFVSCKDYEGDNYAELKNKDASLEEILRLQQQALENCSTKCATQHDLLWAEFQNYQPKGDYALKTDLNNYVSKAKFTTDSTALSNAIKTNATAIKNLEAALKNYVTLEKFTTDSTEFMRLINQNTLAIASAQALAQQAYTLAEQTSALAKSDSVRIDGLTENYNTLNTNFNSFINAWGDDLASAIAEVARVRAMYSVTEADLNSWNTAATNAQNAVNTLNENMEKWNNAADNAQNAVNTLNANMEKWNNAALDA
jgi:chromosome segregation ATPase